MNMLASLLMVHGAASGPWIFDDWMPFFGGIELAAIDVQEGVVPTIGIW